MIAASDHRKTDMWCGLCRVMMVNIRRFGRNACRPARLSSPAYTLLFRLIPNQQAQYQEHRQVSLRGPLSLCQQFLFWSTIACATDVSFCIMAGGNNWHTAMCGGMDGVMCGGGVSVYAFNATCVPLSWGHAISKNLA